MTLNSSSIPEGINGFVDSFGHVATGTAVTGVLMLLGFLLTFKSVLFEKALPGVPELKGVPVLGAALIYLRDGMPELLGRLTAFGNAEGISYAHVGHIVLVSVHSPELLKEVHAFPDDVASRYCVSSSFPHLRLLF